MAASSTRMPWRTCWRSSWDIGVISVANTAFAPKKKNARIASSISWLGASPLAWTTLAINASNCACIESGFMADRIT
jgi:hypothetical protein